MSLDYAIAKIRTRSDEMEKNKELYLDLRRYLQERFPTVLFGDYRLFNDNLTLDAYFLDPNKSDQDQTDLCVEINTFYCDTLLANDLEHISIIGHYFDDVIELYMENVRTLCGGELPDSLKQYEKKESND